MSLDPLKSWWGCCDREEQEPVHGSGPGWKLLAQSKRIKEAEQRGERMDWGGSVALNGIILIDNCNLSNLNRLMIVEFIIN